MSNLDRIYAIAQDAINARYNGTVSESLQRFIVAMMQVRDLSQNAPQMTTEATIERSKVISITVHDGSVRVVDGLPDGWDWQWFDPNIHGQVCDITRFKYSIFVGVQGGEVSEVINLPPGYTYRIEQIEE